MLQDFPELNGRGSFSLDSVSCSGYFAEFMDELQKDELRDLIGEKLGLDLQDKPSMITVRGHTTERDGHIHVDSTSKLVTILIYLNLNWAHEGGKLRLLNNKHDLNDYAAEVSPEAGSCVIFKVTPNCWHGHEIFIGERKAIQLNYVTSLEESERHLKRHRFSAFLKKLFRRNETNSPY